MDCCGRCPQIHEVPPPAHICVRILSAVLYLATVAVVLAGLPAEFNGSAAMVRVSENIELPVAALVFALFLPQYAIESALAYASIVTLWGWKPYHVLQHHLGGAVLVVAMNIQLFYDPPLWLDLLRTHQSIRLVFFSGGFTGVNEALWVFCTFVADPNVLWLTWLRVICGSTILIQNIVISVGGLVFYAVSGLWPLFTETESPVIKVAVILQIAVTGVLQPIAFHLYLQGYVFLGLQCKKTRKLLAGEAKGRPQGDGTKSDNVYAVVPNATAGEYHARSGVLLLGGEDVISKL